MSNSREASTDAPLTIGILALQGAFAAHRRPLQSLGFATRDVRAKADLQGLSGLVLPGGESSAQLLLLDALGMWEALGAFVSSGRPVLATCAGLILLAREVLAPAQRSFGLLDVVVKRNGWGRQRHSCEVLADEHNAPLVMIRAPRLVDVGADVQVLWRWQGEPVLVQQGSCVGAIFHPELTNDDQVHRLAFASLLS